MSIEALVARYGLLAVGLGAAVEGEAAVIAGGLLAHQGLFPLAGTMAAAAVGSFAADQGWFAVGRRLRGRAWVERLRARRAFAWALGALERHPIGFIFAFRFVYGVRTISPIAIGTTSVPTRTFLPVNAAAAAVWAVAFSAIGYLAGQGFEQLAGRLHGARLWWIVAALVAAGLAIGLIHRLWRRA